MKYKIEITTFLLLIFIAFSCNDKEMPCEESCGWQQDCIDGNCECPEGYYKIEEQCKEKRDGYFFGNLNCGCFGDFIISLSLEEMDMLQLIDSGSSTTNFTYSDESIFKATFPKSCILEDDNSQFVDFTIEKLSDLEIKVQTRWWNIENGTLAECESTFVH